MKKKLFYDHTKITGLRESLGLSQGEFGEKIGMSRQVVAKWEKRLTVPSTKTVLKMCNAYKVNFGYFFDYKEV